MGTVLLSAVYDEAAEKYTRGAGDATPEKASENEPPMGMLPGVVRDATAVELTAYG